MANILLLSLIFPPDNVSTAQIMGDLALDLKNKGHSLLVISTQPHFNDDIEAIKKQPLKPYRGRLLQKSNYFGIDVLHIWMPRKGKSKLLRIISWLGFHMVSTLAGFFCNFKPDIILTPSPPLTIGISAWLIGLWHKCAFVYNVQEIYPDVAVNLGVLKNKFLIKVLQYIETFVYDKAKALIIISDGMADNVKQKGVDKNKIFIIPNFVDIEGFQPGSKTNTFSIMHKLADKFVISYAGNMGMPQGLDILIDTAHILRHEKNIHFLMMGDGTERLSLIEKAKKLNLSNISFLTYQPYSLMPDAYAAADVSFVSQAPGTSNDGIPSKVYRIMACGRPVIACTDADSDLSRLITQSGGGIVVTAGDSKALAQGIMKVYENKDEWIQRGDKARSYVVANFSRDSICQKYNDILTDLTRKSI